jgi:hypothetical protein
VQIPSVSYLAFLVAMIRDHIQYKVSTLYYMNTVSVHSHASPEISRDTAISLDELHPESNETHLFSRPSFLDKNNILRVATFKCPAFMHVVARFPAR